MASVEYSDFQSALGTVFEDELFHQMNRATVLLSLLEVKQGNAKNVSWSVRTGSDSGQVFQDGADVSTYNADTIVPASMNYTTYGDAFQLSNFARAAAMAAGNPSEMDNMLREQVAEAAERTADKIITDAYAGNGPSASGAIHGLFASNGALSNTGTYAGIDRSTYPQWASNVLSNSGVSRPLSLDLMRQMRRTIYVASGLKPDLIICDPEQHEKYAKLLQNERRYIDHVRIRGEKITLDAGYHVLEFDGIPVVEDAKCTAGKMAFINTRFLKFFTLPPMLGDIETAGALQVKGHEEEQFGAAATGFICRVNKLANAGDYVRQQPVVYPTLANFRCNASGYISDLG